MENTTLEMSDLLEEEGKAIVSPFSQIVKSALSNQLAS